MTENQKNNIMMAIEDLENKIKDCKTIIKLQVDDSKRWNGAESATAFACRLNGDIRELNGIYTVLKALNYTIEYDKKAERVTDITLNKEITD